jgi:hypothetical protein
MLKFGDKVRVTAEFMNGCQGTVVDSFDINEERLYLIHWDDKLARQYRAKVKYLEDDLEKICETKKHISYILDIGIMMRQAQLTDSFILDAITLAHQDPSINDLMQLWANEAEDAERKHIIADINKHILDDKNLPYPETAIKTESAHTQQVFNNSFEDDVDSIIEEFAWPRQKANLALVKILKRLITESPDLRFGQILYAFKFVQSMGSGAWFDEYNAESQTILERVLKEVDKFKE